MTDIDWREYEPAIRRHEAMSGRDHPHPVDAEGRLSPKFVEWMMALPEGHVTDVDISKTQQLACLGRGVVPAQGAAAFAALLGIEFHTHTHTHTHTSASCCRLRRRATARDRAGTGAAEWT